MLKAPQKFSRNKQVVRDLQCEFIVKYLSARRGLLTYFGLPSSSLEDIVQWSPLLDHITAVERGQAGEGWRLQNELLANAFHHGILSKLTLLRGDIDQIIVDGKDTFGNSPQWPFDVVSLDYSGGLFYRNRENSPIRLEALKSMFARQGSGPASSFVFLLSFNLDSVDQHEVRESVKIIGRDLERFGHTTGAVIDAYLKHPKDQARLKLYVPHLVGQLAVQYQFECESGPPIIYLGNREIEMMAFRFYIRKSARTFAPRLPGERLHQIVNRKMIGITNGTQAITNLNLPLLRRENKNAN